MSCIQIYNGIEFQSEEALKQYIVENYNNLSSVLLEYPKLLVATQEHLYDISEFNPDFAKYSNVLQIFNDWMQTPGATTDVNDYKAWLANKSVTDSISVNENQNDRFDVSNLDTNTAAAFNRIKGIVGENFNFEDAANIANNLLNEGYHTSGYFFGNVIALNSSGFRKGEEYHEAFHAVFRTLMHTNERSRLLDLAKSEFKKPSRTELDALRKISPKYYELSNQQLEDLYYEEKLADEFREYALNNKESKSWLSDLFDKLIDLINTVFGNRALLEKEFDSILAGNYSGRSPKINDFSAPAFSVLYKDNGGLLDRSTSNIILSRLQTILSKNKSVINVKDLNQGDVLQVLGLLKDTYFDYDTFFDLSEAYGLELPTDFPDRILLIHDTIDNPNNLPIMLNEMKNRFSRQDILDDDQDSTDESESDKGSQGELFAGSSIEKGGYLRSPKEIRNFLETLVKYEDFLGVGFSQDVIENNDIFGVRINGQLVYDSVIRRVAGIHKSKILTALIHASEYDGDIKIFKDALLDKILTEYFTSIGSDKTEYDPKIHTHKRLSAYSTTYSAFTSALNKNNSKPLDILVQKAAKKRDEKVRAIRADKGDSVESQIITAWKSSSQGLKLAEDETKKILDSIKSVFSSYANDPQNFSNPKNKNYYKKVAEAIKEQFEKIGIELPVQFIEYSLIQTRLSSGTYDNYNSVDTIFTTSPDNTLNSRLVDKNRSEYESIPSQTEPITLEDLSQMSEFMNGRSGTLFQEKLFEEEEESDSETPQPLNEKEIEFTYRLRKWAKGTSTFDTTHFNTTYRKANGKTAYPLVSNNYLFSITNFFSDLSKSEFVKHLNQGPAGLGKAEKLFTSMAIEQSLITSDDKWVVSRWFNNIINSPRFRSNSKNFEMFSKDMSLYLVNTLKQTKFDENDRSYHKAEKGEDRGDLSGSDRILLEAFLYAGSIGESKENKVTTYKKSITEFSNKTTNYVQEVEWYNYITNGVFSKRLYDDLNSILNSEVSSVRSNILETKAFVDNFKVGKKVSKESKTGMFFGIEELHVVTDTSQENKTIKYYPISRNNTVRVVIDSLTSTVVSKDVLENSSIPNFNKLFSKFRGYKLFTIESIFDSSTFSELSKEQQADLRKKYVDNVVDSIFDNINDKQLETEKERTNEETGEVETYTELTPISAITALDNADWEVLLDAKFQAIVNSLVNENILYFKTDADGVQHIMNKELPTLFDSSAKFKTEKTKVEGEETKVPSLLTPSKKVAKGINRMLDLDQFKTWASNYIISGFNTSTMIDMNPAVQAPDAISYIKRAVSHIGDGEELGEGETKVAVVNTQKEKYDPALVGRTGLKLKSSGNMPVIDTTDGEVFVSDEWLYKCFLHSLGKKNDSVKKIWTKMFAGKNITQEEFDILSDAGASMLKLKLVSRQVGGFYKMGNSVLGVSEFSKPRGEEEVAILDELSRIYVKMLDRFVDYNNNQVFPISESEYPLFANSSYGRGVSSLTLSELKNIMMSMRVPLVGSETLFNTYSNMVRDNSDWLVFNSASKTVQRDVSKLSNTGEGTLYPFAISNSMIRQQLNMTSSIQHTDATDSTQKLALLGSEQMSEAVGFFNGKTISAEKANQAYIKQQQQRILVGMQMVKNQLLDSQGNINMMNLVQTFRETISQTNQDPYIEEFFQSSDNKHFDLNPANYGPTFYKTAAMFLSFVSKNSLKHKVSGAKFSIRTEYGKQIPKLYHYNEVIMSKAEVLVLEKMHELVDQRGNVSEEVLTPDEKDILTKLNRNFTGGTFEEKFTKMLSVEKETTYLKDDEWYSSEVDEYGRDLNSDSRKNNLISRYNFNEGTDDLVLEKLQHRVKDKDGNYYSEVIVSEWVANIFGLNVGDDIPEHLLKFFGVRIPTQDKHSMGSWKIVSLMPSQYGNTIITPYEMIYISGWDMDIDAIYAKMYSTVMSKGKLISYGDYLKEDNVELAVEKAFAEQLSFISNNNPRYKSDVRNAQFANTTLRKIEIELDSLDARYRSKKDVLEPQLDKLKAEIKRLPKPLREFLFLQRSAYKSHSVKNTTVNNVFIDAFSLETLTPYVETYSDGTQQTIYPIQDLFNSYRESEINELRELISKERNSTITDAYNQKIDQIMQDRFNQMERAMDYFDYLTNLHKEFIGQLLPDNVSEDDYINTIRENLSIRANIINEIVSLAAYNHLNLKGAIGSGVVDAQTIYDVFKRENFAKVSNNVSSYKNNNIEDIEPFNIEESNNLQLGLEIALLHNTGTKEIAGTPVDDELIDEAYNKMIKPSETNTSSTTHKGLFGPDDIMIHSNNIKQGDNGIGISASFHATIQTLMRLGVTLSEKAAPFNKRKFTFTDDENGRVNNANSSTITLFVDNASNSKAYLIRMNEITAPVALTLTSLGTIYNKAIGFNNQPVIQKMISYIVNSQGVTRTKQGKGYAFAKELELTLDKSLIQSDESFKPGVMMPFAKGGAPTLNEEDIQNEENLINAPKLYNIVLKYAHLASDTKKLFSAIQSETSTITDAGIVENPITFTVGNKTYSLNKEEDLAIIGSIYNALQGRIFTELKKANNVNNALINLSVLNGIKKGVSGSTDSIDDLYNALDELGVKVSVNRKMLNNKNADINKAVTLTVSENEMFPDLDKIFNTTLNPAFVQNIKSAIFIDKAMASQIFVTRTPSGKRLLDTLYASANKYQVRSSDVKRKIESTALSGLMMARLRVKLANMKKGKLKNIFLDSIQTNIEGLHEFDVFDYEQIFNNNTQVMKEIVRYFKQNDSKYRFLSKLSVRQIEFESLGGETLHKFETPTFTEISPEDSSIIKDEFRMLMEDTNARPLVEAVVRQSFLLQSGRFKKGSLIRTLDLEIVREVMSGMDDVMNIMSFKPGKETEFKNAEFEKIFGMSYAELVKNIEISMFSNPDFRLERKSFDEDRLTKITEALMSKETATERNAEEEELSIEGPTGQIVTDSEDNAEEKTDAKEENEVKFKSQFQIDAPIKVIDEALKDNQPAKVVINLFGGYDKQTKNFRNILEVLDASNLVKIYSSTVRDTKIEGDEQNLNATKNIVTLGFPTLIARKYVGGTQLFKLASVLTAEKTKKGKRVVINPETVSTIYELPTWFYNMKKKSLGTPEGRQKAVNEWNTRLNNEFSTMSKDENGAIMFEGTAAVYVEYHENGNKEISNLGFTLGQLDTMYMKNLEPDQDYPGEYKPKSQFAEKKVRHILGNLFDRVSPTYKLGASYAAKDSKKKIEAKKKFIESFLDKMVNPKNRNAAEQNMTANQYFNHYLAQYKC
jgi:hypothetical protein